MTEHFAVLVEIPRGSRNKYEVDHTTGRMRLDRTLLPSTHYPPGLRLRRGHDRRGGRSAGRVARSITVKHDRALQRVKEALGAADRIATEAGAAQRAREAHLSRRQHTPEVLAGSLSPDEASQSSPGSP